MMMMIVNDDDIDNMFFSTNRISSSSSLSSSSSSSSLFTVRIYQNSRKLIFTISIPFNPSFCQEELFSFTHHLTTDSLWHYLVTSSKLDRKWVVMKEVEKGQGQGQEWALKRNQFPVHDEHDLLYLRQTFNVGVVNKFDQ